VRIRRDDFAANKLDGVVTVFVRDTEATGFPESLRCAAHGVFLDLPGPHKVASSAAACLRPDGVLCSFSPCIEQVQRMCLAMAEAGLTDIRTIEVLDRQYSFSRRAPMTVPAAAAPQAPAQEEAPAAVEGKQGSGQGRAKRPADGSDIGPGGTGAKRVQWKRPGGASAAPQGDQANGEDGDGQPPGNGSAECIMAVDEDAPEGEAPPPQSAPAEGPHPRGRQRRGDPQQGPLGPVVTWPVAEARGHTGYLTFARKPVNPVEEKEGE
jgi:hypothetical protein